MPPTLLEEYDAVVDYLVRYERWAAKVQADLLNPLRRSYWRAMASAGRLYREMDAIRVRRSPLFVELLNNAPASDAPNEESFHRVFISEYPLDELARELAQRFPGASFERLHKLHQSRKQHVLWLDPKASIGFLFGIGTLILKSTPESAVSGFLDYKTFQAWTFWITVAFVGYLAVVIAPLWIKQSGAKTMFERVGATLEYAALVVDKPAEQHETAGQLGTPTSKRD